MPWKYCQKTGFLPHNGILVVVGYSGNGEGFNNPALEHVADVGPLPCGRYKIVGPPFNHPKHGPYCLHIVPDKETRKKILAYGRDPDSFLFHGKPLPPRDINSGSEGCICVSPAEKRSYIYQSGDADLEVVPDLNSKGVPTP